MADKLYCLKCRCKTTAKDTREVTTKNNRLMLKGTCSECGTGVNKFLPAKK